MIKKKNYYNEKIIVRAIEILASQLLWLRQFAGSTIFPFDTPNNPGITISAKGQDKIVLTVGNCIAEALLPQDGDDLLLANGFKYKVYEDGSASIGSVPRQDSVDHPLRREVAKTVLHHGLFKEMKSTPKPVLVHMGEHAKFFADGEVQTDDSHECERAISGAEWWIVYTKNTVTDFVTVVDIVGSGKYSAEGIHAFKQTMTFFHRLPTNAFDHLIDVPVAQAAMASPKPVATKSVEKPVIAEVAEPAKAKPVVTETILMAEAPEAEALPTRDLRFQVARTITTKPVAAKKAVAKPAKAITAKAKVSTEVIADPAKEAAKEAKAATRKAAAEARRAEKKAAKRAAKKALPAVGVPAVVVEDKAVGIKTGVFAAKKDVVHNCKIMDKFRDRNVPLGNKVFAQLLGDSVETASASAANA